MTPEQRRGIALSVAAAATFGVLAPAAKGATQGVAPVAAAGLAYAAAAVFAAAVRVVRAASGAGSWGRRPGRADAARVALMTILGGVVAPALFFEGASRLATADVAVLQHAEFLLTVVGAVVLLAERHALSGWLGVGAIAAGVLATAAQPAAIGAARVDPVGAALVLLAASAWAADNLLARKASGLDPTTTVLWKGAAAGAVLIFWGGPGALTAIPAASWGWIVLAGGVGVGGSLVLELLALRRVGVAANAAIFSTGPTLGAGWGWVLLGDRPSARSLAGLAACVVGIVLLARSGSSRRD